MPMIAGDYRSNLEVPDAYRGFTRMESYPRDWSFGHHVQSDWADKEQSDPTFGIYKRCGSLTFDERAILYACAKQFPGKLTVDIGANVGVTAKTINHATNAPVDCIDPMFTVAEFKQRFVENTGYPANWCFAETSDEYFEHHAPKEPVSLFMIDGDHSEGYALRDAQNAVKYAAPDCALVFHDAIGYPVRDAARWLMDEGWSARMFYTPHVMIVAYRGNFTPPDHQADPHILSQDLPARMPDFTEYFWRLK